MTFGLVHASYSLHKWQAVKLTFFASCYMYHLHKPPGWISCAGGHWGTVNTTRPHKKITKTASPRKNLIKHQHQQFDFCPPILKCSKKLLGKGKTFART